MNSSEKKIEKLLQEIETLKGENADLKTKYGNSSPGSYFSNVITNQIDNEEKYKSIFNSNHVVMLLIDPSSGEIVDANNAACKFYGWGYDEIIRKNISQINTLPSSELKEMMRKAKDENHNHFHFDHRLANGEIRKVEVHSGPIKIGNKNLLYSIIHDITVRITLETGIKESEERFRQLIWGMQVGVMLQGPKAEIILCNPKSLELLGLTEDQLLGKTSFDPDWNVIHEDGSPFPGNTHPVPQAIVSGKPVTNVVMGVYHPANADRVWLLVDAIPLFNSDSTVRQVICTFIDITARKQAGEALLESENRLDRAEKVAKIGNWKLMLTSKRIISSSGARIIYGIDKDSMSLEDIQKIPLPEYRQMLDEELDKLITKNIPFNVEYKIRRPNDGKIVDINSIADYDKENNIIFGVVQDITTRKQTEGEIKKKNDELIKINSEKDKFFSIIAHDLRSPFEGLLHLTEYMANESQDFTISEFIRVSQSLNNSAVNVFKLLNNLLEWALIQQGKMSLEIQKLNLSEILELNLDILKERASQKNIAVVNRVDDSLIVLSDEKMLNSIVRNLLSNAVKFTPVNGNVFLSARELGNNMIEISVNDSGIGIPGELCKKLFKIEEQVGRAGTEGEHSSGIGLVLCREFVEMLGGEIWVESRENVGSTFYFTIPKSIAL
jgi:PAS domain S-box-containing protein